jgi:uncharacterized protein YndB with AHSA1/START domain
MLTTAAPLTFTRTVAASPAEVYRAFIVPAALQDWLCAAAQVEPQPGGRVYCWWESGYYTAGTLIDLLPDARLAFTWQGPGEPPATLRVDLAPEGAATTVRVTYAGEQQAADGAPAAIAPLWEAALENLQSLLETGVDLRVARRPMFGLDSAEELTPDQAAQLGVPVTAGLWLGGVVAGLGAHAAGLQRDDVIVSLGERPVTGWPSFLAALQGYQAGDEVPVAFYRGAARHVVPLTLARRVVVPPPASLEELVALARDVYAVAEAELTACLSGVTEATADYRPTAAAWTIKEIVAHLIAIELDVQTWIAVIIEDGHGEWPFHANTTERMQALVQGYPTLAELTAALRRCMAVNLALLALLPPAAVRRRHRLGHLAGHLREGLVDHNREHIAEIAALAQAAPSS